ncbi:unnamed protein product [Orchesella dallaii]|uniref:Uncharacterized protein n=1 Tax=Orchesella dallaii TaxID=48710 RepID=A0ABP1RVY6_9HEXA
MSEDIPAVQKLTHIHGYAGHTPTRPDCVLQFPPLTFDLVGVNCDFTNSGVIGYRAAESRGQSLDLHRSFNEPELMVYGGVTPHPETPCASNIGAVLITHYPGAPPDAASHNTVQGCPGLVANRSTHILPFSRLIAPNTHT